MSSDEQGSPGCSVILHCNLHCRLRAARKTAIGVFDARYHANVYKNCNNKTPGGHSSRDLGDSVPEPTRLVKNECYSLECFGRGFRCFGSFGVLVFDSWGGGALSSALCIICPPSAEISQFARVRFSQQRQIRGRSGVKFQCWYGCAKAKATAKSKAKGC